VVFFWLAGRQLKLWSPDKTPSCRDKPSDEKLNKLNEYDRNVSESYANMLDSGKLSATEVMELMFRHEAG
jgi:hypothetical protein